MKLGTLVRYNYKSPYGISSEYGKIIAIRHSKYGAETKCYTDKYGKRFGETALKEIYSVKSKRGVFLLNQFSEISKLSPREVEKLTYFDFIQGKQKDNEQYS